MWHDDDDLPTGVVFLNLLPEGATVAGFNAYWKPWHAVYTGGILIPDPGKGSEKFTPSIACIEGEWFQVWEQR